MLRIVLAIVATVLLLGGALPMAAQDSEGRDTRPKSAKPRPKKRIRARPPADIERVPVHSVVIRSYPPGAEVLFDGSLVGTTADDGELELSDVRLGQHRIVLRKDGYREWAQTVLITKEDVEIEPLLQSENALMPRDISKTPRINFGSPVSGQLNRDDMLARDGRGYFDEYALTVDKAEAFIVRLTATGFTPSVKLIDNNNKAYALVAVSPDVLQSVHVPSAGTYFLQVATPIDESTFAAGDYQLTVVTESVAYAARPISLGQTLDGVLEPTDQPNGDYVFDSYSFDAAGPTRLRVAATSDAFTPGLLVMQGSTVLASTSTKDKKKKGFSGSELTADLTGGNYTIQIRSAAGPKHGAYQITLSAAPGR